MSRRQVASESESEGEELSFEEKIKSQLVEKGELERLKDQLKNRLIECGWKDEVRQLCKEFVDRRGIGNVTPEDIVRAVRSLGQKAVPDSVKGEFVSEVRKAIVKATT